MIGAYEDQALGARAWLDAWKRPCSSPSVSRGLESRFMANMEMETWAGPMRQP